MNLTILRFDRIGSTNTEAIEQAKRGADEGLVVIAREQTSGRGRNGRTWISEKDAGLFFSIVLRPQVETKFLPLLTMMAAVGVFEMLKSHGLDPDIKWPNDVLVDEKKISGILAETAETPRGRAIIIGIGINLRYSNYLPEVAALITSVEKETGRQPDPEDVLRVMTRILSGLYDVFCSEEGPQKIRQAWSERSSYLEGADVTAITASGTISGTTRGIEENGALRIETKDGSIESIHAGDVTRVRKV
jgi:BirA family transcriptional regulator, biotin operon repressor / biotin---[acetyl-CoA-carboxylase] ligase